MLPSLLDEVVVLLRLMVKIHGNTSVALSAG